MFMVDGLALSGAVQTTFITSGTATLLAMMIRRPARCMVCTSKTSLVSTAEDAYHGALRPPSGGGGVFVYSLFSKSGALGSLDLLFTVQAMIFAQTCLILPLVWVDLGPPLRA